jgi:hypothetical protein
MHATSSWSSNSFLFLATALLSVLSLVQVSVAEDDDTIKSVPLRTHSLNQVLPQLTVRACVEVREREVVWETFVLCSETDLGCRNIALFRSRFTKSVVRLGRRYYNSI